MSLGSVLLLLLLLLLCHASFLLDPHNRPRLPSPPLFALVIKHLQIAPIRACLPSFFLQTTGDIEDSSVMSHISVESARSGSWSGSVVGGFGFVDYPAGIPLKQWVRDTVQFGFKML